MNNLMLMEPRNLTFQELMSNGVKYTVPRFQRDYAWELEQWEDLWADIQSLDEEHYHYMGYIVLQRKGQHDFVIIDGQQRLVTLSLLILAAMKHIKQLAIQGTEAQANQERLNVLTDRFIGAKNPVSLRVNSKLSLNRNNQMNYKFICSKLDTILSRGLILSNKLLLNAFSFFADKEMGSSGSEIAEFIEKLTVGMVFTKIVVEDDLNAYKVFETLNARGVQLSTPDLLKNYIFSIVTINDDIPDEQVDDLDKEWAWIVTQLGENNFTDFIRYHHNFQQKIITKKQLFVSIRRLVDTSKKAYDYLESLTKYAPIYAALLNHNDELWANKTEIHRNIKKYLEGFNIFNIKQAFSILMVAFIQFSSNEFIKLVRYIYILSIRYNVICNFSPHEQEKVYSQIAVKIFNGSYVRASHVKNGEEFRKLYPTNEEFFNAFEFHKIPSRQYSKKIRFLLSEIEAYLGNESDYTKTTLEHICPYNPEQHWYEYFGEGINDIQDRLGNVILLEKDELKRSNFEDKKKFYLKSPFSLAQKVAEYQEWNIENLNHYQVWLAEQAVNTWKLDF